MYYLVSEFFHLVMFGRFIHVVCADSFSLLYAIPLYKEHLIFKDLLTCG